MALSVEDLIGRAAAAEAQAEPPPPPRPPAEPPQEKPPLVVRAIDASGRALAGGIVRTGEVVGHGVRLAGDAVVRNSAKAEADVAVSARAQRATDAVATGAAAALEGTRYVTAGVVGALKRASLLVSDRVDSGEPADGPPSTGRQALQATVSAVVDVYHSARATARAVGTDVREAAVAVAEHRGGAEVAGVTDRAMGALGDVAKAAWNVHTVADAGVVDLAAETADAVVSRAEWLEGDEVLRGPLRLQVVAWRARLAVLLPNALLLFSSSSAGSTGPVAELGAPTAAVPIEDIRRAEIVHHEGSTPTLEVLTRDDVRYRLKSAAAGDHAPALADWLAAIEQCMAQSEERRRAQWLRAEGRVGSS